MENLMASYLRDFSHVHENRKIFHLTVIITIKEFKKEKRLMNCRSL